MIMDESYKQELLEYIAETPDLIFEAYNHTRESVLQHIEELWTAYQKDVEEYECTADWSYADAMQEVLGILIPNNAAPWKASEPTKSAEQMTYADKIRQMSDEELREQKSWQSYWRYRLPIWMVTAQIQYSAALV